MRARLLAIRPYILAAFTVALAFGVKAFIQPYISTSPPFIMFLVAIMFTAWKSGFFPAFFATILSAVVIDYWLIPPIETFAMTPGDFGTLLLFMLIGTSMAYFIDSQEQDRRQAVSLQGQLERLHKFSTRLLAEDKFESLLHRVLSAAVELPRAEKGTLQLYDPKANELEMVAQVGFGEGFFRQYQGLPLDFATCGAAYQRQTRVIIENITSDPEFGHLAPLYSNYQVVSAQSTPLLASDRQVLGVLTTYACDAGVPTEEQLRMLDLYADQAARIIEVKRKEADLSLNKLDLEAQVLSGENKLREQAAELAMTEHRERRALSSELHDYLAQLLTLGKLKLRLAQQFLGSSPDRSESYILETADALQRSLDYARTLIAELAPPELDEAGLAAALRWLAGQMTKHGLAVDLRLDAESLDLPHDQAMWLYRCVRELLLNVVKHAQVSEASVALTVDSEQRLMIIVKDHGTGYDPASINADRSSQHFGLASIRERLDTMGGRIREESSIGKGTSTTLTVPLADHGTRKEWRTGRSLSSVDQVERTSRESADQERLPFAPP